MRLCRLLPLLLIFLFTAFSCSKKTGREYANSPTGEEIDPYQNISFAFDEPVAPPTQAGAWDSTRYVQFEPAIKGKFRWVSEGRELVFSPFEPLRPSTVFRASLRKAALPVTKQWVTLDRTKFHTPLVSITTTQVYYGRSEQASGTTELRAKVLFNYPVRPADLHPRLTLTQHGRPVAYTLTSTEPDREMSLLITQAVKPGEPLQFTVAPGLLAVDGTEGTAAPLAATADVPEQLALEVRELTGEVVDGEAIVTILTNQPVTVADVQPLLQVSPRVQFSIETQESGLLLRGGFEVGKNYQITIKAGLRGALGGRLQEKFEQTVGFGNIMPSISFASAEKAMYLNALGSRNLGLRLNKIEKVKVTIAKVYASNVQEFLRSGKQYSGGEGGEYDGEGNEGGEESSEEGEGSGSYQYYELENRGDVLFTRTYATSGLAKKNGLHLLNLSLKDLEFNAPLKGVYVVRVQDTEHLWLREEKLVVLTDLGMIARQNLDGGTVVFLNSLRTAQPVSGATVRFISTNNQVMGTATTNGQGVAHYDSVAGSRFRLGMVTVGKDADFSFLSLPRMQVETSRFDVGGLTRNAARYQAFLYGDRDLYRPGDTLYTNTIVRSETWGTPPAGLPVKVRLLLPTGKEYASLGERLSAAGSVASRFILPATAMTGLYTQEVLTGNDVLLTSRQVSVEEFIPDRLKVSVVAAPAVGHPAETIAANITAQNLFGPPAAGRKFEVEFSLKAKPFTPKNYSDYTFTIQQGTSETSGQQFQKEQREGETDATGHGAATYVLPDVHDLGTLEGTAFATVFDETGRPVNRVTTFEVQTQTTMFGIGELPSLVGTHQTQPIQLVALTPAGQPTHAEAQVTVVRKLWETVLERQGDRYIYNSQQRDEVVFSKRLTLKGTDKILYRPQYSGEYEVRIRRPEATSYVAAPFYAYGSGDTAGNSFEVNNEGEVIIEADQPKYEPGQTAQLLLKSPFAGRILVTVERDRVLDHFYVDTDQKSARVSIPIRGEHVPTIYITATAIRPIVDNALPLTVARGFLPLAVEKPSTHLPVQLTVAAQSRSQVFQTIQVRTAPRAQVTLAVVDEGILQRTGYHTPDPYAYFYQKRALEVSAFDIYPFLLPELGSSSSGGDAADMGRRTTPVPNRRVRLLAKWSGVLTADDAGLVQYKVHLPQFSGALRVMAVAYKDDAFGNAEQTMKVADPVVISTALPRFMSPGDTIDVPVTLTNTTGKSTGVAEIKIETTGPVMPIRPTSKSDAMTEYLRYADLLPNREKQVVFRVIAGFNSTGNNVGIGNASVKITVSTGKTGQKADGVYSELIEVPVRPAAPLEKRTGSGDVTAGTPATLDLRTDFLPSSLRSKMLLSRSPLTQFSKNLDYLLQYPYGCLEQTVSAAFPQLYFGDLAATLSQKTGPRVQRYNPNHHVQEAIRKIESMQLYNGSLSYWPAGDYDNWWATAYAAHFLIEAKQAGFTVNQAILTKVLDYLQFRIRQRETETYYYYENGLRRERVIAKREITYSLYVLALAGRQDATALNYYRANRSLLTVDARFLLAGTYALGGQQKAFQDVLPRQFVPESGPRELDGSFSSPIRTQALALNALFTADPNNPQVASIARQLSRQVRDASYMNTQESAFSLLALGKIARRVRTSTVTGVLAAGGKTLGKFDGKDLTVSNVANYQLLLKASGAGGLYYFWEMEGISASGQVREEDNYLKVRREFLTRDGRPVGRAGFRQNDLVLVKITLRSAEAAGEVKNVAITDLLPAGLEIENPRLGPQREVDGEKAPSTPDYLDVRDDRINLFTTASPEPKTFYYLARAVSKGTFKLGPVSADAMYNGEYHSYNGAGVVRVR